MKAKRYLLTVLLLGVVCSLSAQQDSLARVKIRQHEQLLTRTKTTTNMLQQRLDAEELALRRLQDSTRTQIDRLGAENRQAARANDSLVQSQRHNVLWLWCAIVALSLLILSAVMLLIIYARRMSASFRQLQNRQAAELAELLDRAFSAPPEDHSLATALLNELTRMEMNIKQMDSQTKGYKQLSNAILRTKDTLAAKGYRTVEILDQEYHEQMLVSATFTDDPTLEKGRRVISAVIVPTILYQGETIQSGSIKVNQNL